MISQLKQCQYQNDARRQTLMLKVKSLLITSMVLYNQASSLQLLALQVLVKPLYSISFLDVRFPRTLLKQVKFLLTILIKTLYLTLVLTLLTFNRMTSFSKL